MSQEQADLNNAWRITDNEGGKLKSTSGWTAPNTGATDEYGFTALPGGNRINSDGTSYDVGNFGIWWSSTQSSSATASSRPLHYNTAGVGRASYDKSYGFSVRCLRN
jgi:uncharacterized protein (TIGR02145 family)